MHNSTQAQPEKGYAPVRGTLVAIIYKTFFPALPLYGKPSMTWSQSVDQALCFGWIDGVRKSIDKESYQIRFTPRKLTSIWSAINIQKIAELTNQGLMYPVGLEIFENRRNNNSNGYSSKDLEVKFSSELEKQFKANKKAWTFFQSLASSYRKPSVNWVMR